MPRFFSTRILSDVGIGLGKGVVMAVFFSALSSISLVLSQRNTFEIMHMTWLRGVSCYLISGILSGIIWGVMRPFVQGVFGSAVIGGIAGGITGVVFAFGEFGRSHWSGNSIGFAVFLLFLGTIFGPLVRASNLRKSGPTVSPP
jgi:hypothetical protein